MGDDTIYPSSMYPGGSEDDFAKLKAELAALRNRHAGALRSIREHIGLTRAANERAEAERRAREAVEETIRDYGYECPGWVKHIDEGVERKDELTLAGALIFIFEAERRAGETIRAETIEECAKVCESQGLEIGSTIYSTATGKQCAAAIRALKEAALTQKETP